MPLTIPNTLANGINADATKLNANFTAIKNAVDPLMLATLPTGAMCMWSTNAAPSGFLLCQGQAVSRTTYSTLFGVIGTTYGNGDGATTFNVPNMKGRLPVGLDSADGDFDLLGELGGQKTVQQHNHAIDHDHPAATSGSGSPHSHTIIVDPHTHDLGVRDNASTYTNGTGAPTSNQFSANGTETTTSTTATASATIEDAHTHSVNLPAFSGTSGTSGTGATNMNPYIVINFIIRT